MCERGSDKKPILSKKKELKINRDICCRSAREYRDRQKDWQAGRIETYAVESNQTGIKNKQKNIDWVEWDQKELKLFLSQEIKATKLKWQRRYKRQNAMRRCGAKFF